MCKIYLTSWISEFPLAIRSSQFTADTVMIISGHTIIFRSRNEAVYLCKNGILFLEIQRKTLLQNRELSRMIEPRTLTVCPKGGAEYSTILAAIHDAVEGDIVQLKIGHYDEVVVLDKCITIESVPNTDISDVIIAGGLLCTFGSVPSSAVKIPMMTADNPSGQQSAMNSISAGAAAAASSDASIVHGNVPASRIDGGSSRSGTRGGTVRRVTIGQMVDVRSGSAKISECEITLGIDGVRIAAGCDPLITQCKIHSSQSGGDGVYFQPGSFGTVERCEIYGHRVNGVHVNGGNATILNNRIFDCPFGIYYRNQGKGLCEDNTLDNISRFGIYICHESNPTVCKNTLANCGVHGIVVSKNGAGSLDGNVCHGSFKVFQGSHPSIGVNAVDGRMYNDNNLLTNSGVSSVPAAAAPVPVK